MTFATGMAFGEMSGYWTFDGNLSPAGKAGVFEKGTPPVFDADTPGPNIWNGATFSVVNPNTKHS
jgi:hypothetical protein